MERSQLRQTPAHLLGIFKVERLAHALAVLHFGRGASVGGGLPGLPKVVRVAGESLVRPGRHAVEIFIEDDVLVSGDCRDTHGGMLGACVREGSCPFVPLTSEGHQTRREVAEPVIGAATANEVGSRPYVPAVDRVTQARETVFEGEDLSCGQGR